MTALAAASERILADHSALLALPAFLPAVLVAGVVFYVARRDRRRGDDEDESVGAEQEGHS